jgi:CHASE1-domain containing sensor protein
VFRAAIDDGYEPFLPNVQQPHYHFTRKWNGLKAAFSFDPKQPTSLLYRKTPDGYELEGAMFTAPKWASEGNLNERIPLSIAQWHAHVNICLPQKKDMQSADWKKFGPKGSILTEAECKQAGGRFVPQLFGWMVHVYPFEETPEKIWTH